MVSREKYYSVSEVAKIMNVCVETIRRYIADRRLPALKLPGGHYRIKQTDLKFRLASIKSLHLQTSKRIENNVTLTPNFLTS